MGISLGRTAEILADQEKKDSISRYGQNISWEDWVYFLELGTDAKFNEPKGESAMGNLPFKQKERDLDEYRRFFTEYIKANERSGRETAFGRANEMLRYAVTAGWSHRFTLRVCEAMFSGRLGNCVSV